MPTVLELLDLDLILGPWPYVRSPLRPPYEHLMMLLVVIMPSFDKNIPVLIADDPFIETPIVYSRNIPRLELVVFDL
jgi:hypothetical protein